MEYNLHCQGDEYTWSIYLNLPQQIARYNGKPAGLRVGYGKDEGYLFIDPELPKNILGVFKIDRTHLTFTYSKFWGSAKTSFKGQCRKAPAGKAGYQL